MNGFIAVAITTTATIKVTTNKKSCNYLQIQFRAAGRDAGDAHTDTRSKTKYLLKYSKQPATYELNTNSDIT